LKTHDILSSVFSHEKLPSHLSCVIKMIREGIWPRGKRFLEKQDENPLPIEFSKSKMPISWKHS
jgi:hypothetical protein